MSKKLTEAQIQAQAIGLGIEVAALKAVIEVECKGSGFNADGTPVILFERHVFRQRLIANGKAAINGLWYSILGVYIEGSNPSLLTILCNKLHLSAVVGL